MNILDDMVEQPTPWTADGVYLGRRGDSRNGNLYVTRVGENLSAGTPLFRSRLPLSQYVAADKVKAGRDMAIADAYQWCDRAANFLSRAEAAESALAAMTAERDQLKQQLDAVRCALDGFSAHIRKLIGQRDALRDELAALKSAPAPAADDGEWEDCSRYEFAQTPFESRRVYHARYQRRRVTLNSLAARVAALESKEAGRG